MTAPATYDCFECEYHVVDWSDDPYGFDEAVTEHEEYHRHRDEREAQVAAFRQQLAGDRDAATSSTTRPTSAVEGAHTMRGLALAVYVCVGFWLIVGAVVLTLTTDRFDGRTLAAAALVVAGVGCWLLARVGSRRAR